MLCRWGHTIEFATLAECKDLAQAYPFVSKFHLVRRANNLAEEEELHILRSTWTFSSAFGKKDFIRGNKSYDALWPQTYSKPEQVVDEGCPDFAFAAYHVEAARVAVSGFEIPLVDMWPQMP